MSNQFLSITTPEEFLDLFEQLGVPALALDDALRPVAQTTAATRLLDAGGESAPDGMLPSPEDSLGDSVSVQIDGQAWRRRATRAGDYIIVVFEEIGGGERGAQFEQIRRDAEVARRAKGEFLANMSHQVRTPLSAILGYTRLLRGTAEADEVDWLDTIERNSRFLLRIMNDILDLSRIEAGELSLDLQEHSPVRLALDVYDLMRMRARQVSVDFRVETDGRLPNLMRTDPARLRQVLVNLVGNAIKFTEEGEVCLRVRFEKPDGIPQIRFDVSDTGIGLTEADRATVFAPFQQGDAARRVREGGTGLGLTICLRLVRALGGNLEVETERGQGSTFSVWIPVGDVEFDLVEQGQIGRLAEIALEPARVTRRLDIPCHVLVADDNEDIRHLTRQWLDQAGCRVTTVNDGAEAMTLVREMDVPPKAIVMDMQMPLVDGYEATSRLRDDGYVGAILALTAAAMPADRQRCMDVGCDAYLAKPVEADALVDAIARLVEPDGGCSSSRAAAEISSDRDDTSTAEAKTRVLIVEDDVDSSRMLSMFLSRSGLEVRTAADGESALHEVNGFEPDVAVLDLGLPDMDGVELFRQLRERQALAETRFFALSGRAPWERKDPEMDQFERYFQKPINPEELRSAIANI